MWFCNVEVVVKVRFSAFHLSESLPLGVINMTFLTAKHAKLLQSTQSQNIIIHSDSIGTLRNWSSLSIHHKM
jgi:hypothetical protein